MIRNLIHNIKNSACQTRYLMQIIGPNLRMGRRYQPIVASKLCKAPSYQFTSSNQTSDNLPPDEHFPTNSDTPNLMTLAMVSKRLELTEEEEKQAEQEYCLFSSPQPIFPNSKMSCSIKIGNLKDINHPLLYSIICPDNGEIYTVGVALSKNVEVSLNKQFKNQGFNDSLINQQFQLEVMTKKSNYRIKITEIRITNEGIYAKGIQYKDRKLTKSESEFNVKGIFGTINEQMKDIIKIGSYDKLELMKDIDMTFFDRLDIVKPEEIDTMIYQIALNLQRGMNQYMRENTAKFVQRLLESRTYVDRVLILQNQVQIFYDAMSIVDRHVRQAEGQMSKYQTQQVARLAQEYIRQTYFRDGAQTMPPLNNGNSNSLGGVGSLGSTAGTAQERSGTGTNPLVKKFYEKLQLIDDLASREKVRKEIERFSQLDKNSSEFSKINAYLDEVFSVPWKQFTPVEWDSEYAAKILDQEIYGLEKVKQRILQMIAVNQLKNSDEKSKGFILLLNGPPGTGKTSIAKTVAKCLKRTSRFISFAGVADPHFFKGHRRTYVDSQPGVFVKELIKANSMNPVFILDEVDKIAKHHSGADPYYSLLEILNTEENHNFTDHYLDIATDFSKVIFILTSNSLMSMLEPLQNRLEVIEVSAYIQEEKLAIGKGFIIPKVLELNGIQQDLIKYDDETINKIIKGWCYYESGVRELKRQFEKIARKYAQEIVAAKPGRLVLDNDPDQAEIQGQCISYDYKNVQKLDLTKDKNLELIQKYLGPPIFDAYSEYRNTKTFPPGQLNILTVSGGMIGHVTVVECCFDNSEWDKKGQITSSGNLKNVLQESLKLAKINAVKYLNEEQIKLIQRSNIHIHFMDGAVPKDGPSAGTAITTALISLASGFSVPSNISMTGEISLNGNVCKIGCGVQQKLIASKTLGINDVILPKANLGDVLELTKSLLNGMNLYFVDKYDDVYALIFHNKLKAYKESKQLDLNNVIILKDGVITSNVENTIYSNYGIQQEILDSN